MVSLIQLEYLIAVDTYRHFVTAAEKCFVTQPTLSMQIKKLEEHLGVVIFDRSKQPVIPTEAGIKIIEQARETLAASKRIYDIIDEHNQSLSGELTIGIIPSLAPYLLPLFIGHFTHTYPKIKIKIVELLSEEIVQQLNKDQIDVGLLVTPLNETKIIEKPLFYEKMMLYVNKNHAFCSKQEIKAQEIASADIWLLSKGHCFRSQVVNLCSFKIDKQANASLEYESGSLETLKKLVEKEGGYTLLPELAVNELTSNNAIIRPISNPSPIREVSLVYSRNYAKKRLIELLSKEIQEAIKPEMLDRHRGKVVEWK